GPCVFVVINIVRDNPSFFVAYFLFTQEFILNQYFAKSNASPSKQEKIIVKYTGYKKAESSSASPKQKLS
ncbi:hypothetical protein, partial [Lactobacillus delbrueckii]|uniref:hypothetical protein n=1 Tax=Lactobacillus delbrueckii TaxID=1584 RepID=UPI0021A347FA